MGSDWAVLVEKVEGSLPRAAGLLYSAAGKAARLATWCWHLEDYSRVLWGNLWPLI